tara:strand:- start:4641 stop:4988 length:348 start_codon:yes stop_codon:yes gene_type:complete
LVEYLCNSGAQTGDLFDSYAELDTLFDQDAPGTGRLADALARIAHAEQVGRRILGRIWRQPDLYKVNASPYAIFCVCKASSPRTVHVVFTDIVKGKPDFIDILAEIAKRRALAGV